MTTLTEWIMGLLSFLAPSLADPGPTIYNGYVEGDYVYVAAAASGRIAQLETTEGVIVIQGALLFQIENSAQIAAMRGAEAQVDLARANLENLLTGGRSAEIAVIRASLDQAIADQHLAQTTLDRTNRLYSSGAISQSRVDTDSAKLDAANGRVAQLQAQLQVAELPARDAQRIAAQAAVDAAEAQLEMAQSALSDRTIVAPVSGTVDKVYFDAGEVAGAGTPVVAILPPGQLRALFYVPEPARTSVQIGDVFDLGCNGCPAGTQVRVSRLASSPQYTPPIIYSREESSRLVFRVEAEILNPGDLLPGQPISLSPQP